MTSRIDHTADTINSLDILDRITELAIERSSYEHGITEWERTHPKLAEELASLRSLAEEAESYDAGFDQGITLTRDDLFDHDAQPEGGRSGLVSVRIRVSLGRTYYWWWGSPHSAPIITAMQAGEPQPSQVAHQLRLDLNSAST